MRRSARSRARPLSDLTDRQTLIFSIVTKYVRLTGVGCPASVVATTLGIHHEAVRGHFLALHRKGWIRSSGSPALPLRRAPAAAMRAIQIVPATANGTSRAPRPTAQQRFDVLKRDKFTCQYCGRKAPDVPLVVDHKAPLADGGRSEESNLVTSCQDCNAGKAAASLEPHPVIAASAT